MSGLVERASFCTPTVILGPSFCLLYCPSFPTLGRAIEPAISARATESKCCLGIWDSSTCLSSPNPSADAPSFNICPMTDLRANCARLHLKSTTGNASRAQALCSRLPTRDCCIVLCNSLTASLVRMSPEPIKDKSPPPPRLSSHVMVSWGSTGPHPTASQHD